MEQDEMVKRFLDMCINEGYTIAEIEDTLDEIKKELKNRTIK